MAWTGGTTRTTGTVITASFWNAHLGAGGDLDWITDGVKILNQQVFASSMLTRQSANQGKILMAASGLSGGLNWAQPHQLHAFVSRCF